MRFECVSRTARWSSAQGQRGFDPGAHRARSMGRGRRHGRTRSRRHRQRDGRRGACAACRSSTDLDVLAEAAVDALARGQSRADRARPFGERSVADHRHDRRRAGHRGRRIFAASGPATAAPTASATAQIRALSRDHSLVQDLVDAGMLTPRKRKRTTTPMSSPAPSAWPRNSRSTIVDRRARAGRSVPSRQRRPYPSGRRR